MTAVAPPLIHLRVTSRADKAEGPGLFPSLDTCCTISALHLQLKPSTTHIFDNSSPDLHTRRCLASSTFPSYSTVPGTLQPTKLKTRAASHPCNLQPYITPVLHTSSPNLQPHIHCRELHTFTPNLKLNPLWIAATIRAIGIIAVGLLTP